MAKNQDARRPSPADEARNQPTARPEYESPRITPMSEKDVLKSFQVTGAASSWWGM